MRSENCVFQKAVFRCNSLFSIFSFDFKLHKSISDSDFHFANRIWMLAFQFENRPFNSTFYFVSRLLIFDFDFSL